MPDAFEKLQQLILDENKTVTYKTLCRSLDIPANKAKQCLSDFFEEYGTKHGLSALYVLIGVASLKKSAQLCTKAIVVTDDELEKAKNQYSSLNSIHVYAVQKGKLTDENSLYNADYGKMDQVEDHNKFSSIRNPYIYVQAGQQIKHVTIPKDNDLWKPNAPSNQTAPKKESPKVPTTKNKTPNLFSLFPKKSDEPSKPRPEIAQNPTKTDSSAEQNKGKNSSPQKVKGGKPASSGSSSNSAVKNDVKYFFAKQAEKPPKSEAKSSESKDNAKMNNKEKETKVSSKEVKSPPEMNSSSSRLGGKKTKPEKSKMSRKPKRQNANDSDEDFAPKKKKHKRILTMDDSDSESENEQEKEDKARRDLFEEEPPVLASVAAEMDEDVIPPTPPVKNGKKKKWKVVKKTFEDEDGFLVTKNQKELVTDSEDSGTENPAPSKAPVKKESPKSSSVQKKQSSLMNFFKQK